MAPPSGGLAGRLFCQSEVSGLGRVPQELGTAFLFGGVPDPLGRNGEGVSARRNPRLGSCSQGIGPDLSSARRSASRPR